MANKYTNLNDLFVAIADAIRTKKNSTETIIADNFPMEIENLNSSSGFDYVNSKVTTIPNYAFYGCEELNSVDCENITSIGASAFENCINLKSIIIYDNVEFIEENAFKGCNGLTIYCKAFSKPESWNNNWNPDNCEVVWGYGHTLVESWDISDTETDSVTASLYNTNIENDYLLSINGNGKMKGYDNFYNLSPWSSYKKNITSVNMSDGVTSIGNYAFIDCSSLQSITVPDSVTSIGYHAFYDCSSLTTITVPDSVKSIGYWAFYGCPSLQDVYITDLSAWCNIDFENSYSNPLYFADNLYINGVLATDIVIPSGVTSIGDYAFSNYSSLTSITISDGVTSIGKSAFSDCSNLTSFTYIGTTTQWQSITFATNWNSHTPDYTVHCKDGDIAKDGTITYH